MDEGEASDRRGGDASAVFFATAPAAPIAAGGLVLLAGSSALVSAWSPRTLALTHLGTLGFLVMALVGGLYRVVPGATGFKLIGWFGPRAIHAGLCAGIAALVVGFLGSWSPVLFAAFGILALTLVLLFYSFGSALRRSDDAIPPGTRTAVASLLLTVTLGLWMGHWHVGVPFYGDRPLWIQVHMSLGLLGWVGGAIFVMSRHELAAVQNGTSPAVGRATVALVQVGVVAVTLVALADLVNALAARSMRLSGWAAVAIAPAAVAVWGIQPLSSLRAIARIRDAAMSDRLACWRVSFVSAFVAAAAALAALSSVDPRWTLVFGWSAIWGWSGFFVHGLIREDGEPGDAARSDRRGRRVPIRAALGVHLVSFVLGVCAIATGNDWIARLTGASLVLTGVALAVDRHRTRQPAAAAPSAQAR